MGEPEYSRAERVAGQLHRELADLVARDLRDPRIHLASITRVELSRDLRHARVLVTAPPEVDADGAVRALGHAAGYLRRRIGERVRLRYLPELRFERDEGLEEALRVEALLRRTASERDDGGEGG